MSPPLRKAMLPLPRPRGRPRAPRRPIAVPAAHLPRPLGRAPGPMAGLLYALSLLFQLRFRRLCCKNTAKLVFHEHSVLNLYRFGVDLLCRVESESRFCTRSMR